MISLFFFHPQTVGKIFEAEEKLRKLSEQKNRYEKKREVFNLARKVIEFRKNVEEVKKKKRELVLIIKERKNMSRKEKL